MPPTRVRAVTATLEGRVVPGGQAFLLAKFVDEKKSFRHYSPYKIRDQLMLVLESRVDEVSALRSGALLLKTYDYEQTEALMAWTFFCGESIRVIPADRLNQVEGIVYAPELTSESPQTILEESVDQGVTSVTRLPSKTTRPNPPPESQVLFDGAPGQPVRGLHEVRGPPVPPSPSQVHQVPTIWAWKGLMQGQRRKVLPVHRQAHLGWL